MSLRSLLLLPVLSGGVASAKSTVYYGGTIVAFDRAKEGLRIIRDGSITVTDDIISSISETSPRNVSSRPDAESVDITGKIVTPGFVDTHRHGWQTAYRTIASNTSLVEYFGRYGEFVSGDHWTADDVYSSQLTGLYEALAAGVTTSLDHAHHTWSPETSEAGLQASIDSGARVFWAYAFHEVNNFTVADQLVNFRDIAQAAKFNGTATSLGVAYDSFGPDGDVDTIKSVMSLAKEFNVPIITTHSLQGPWGYTNSPEDLHNLGYLNNTAAIVFSHAAFLTARGASLLRSSNQYISITPESEMHYGHTHPKSYFIQDQAALGVDTHFTFSTDILTQARIWLQQARYEIYADASERWQVPRNNPQSAAQAFMLATRNGGLALRREDLGVIEVGAKADLVFWDGDSPALLGWVDPVAAVILHASVGDIDTVLVDGKVVKQGGKLVVDGYDTVKANFLQTAKKIQETWRNTPLPAVMDTFYSGATIVDVDRVDIQRGDGDGYGDVFV